MAAVSQAAPAARNSFTISMSRRVRVVGILMMKSPQRGVEWASENRWPDMYQCTHTITFSFVKQKWKNLPPSRLETEMTLNPTLATPLKWAEALGRRLDVELEVG